MLALAVGHVSDVDQETWLSIGGLVHPDVLKRSTGRSGGAKWCQG